MDKLARFLRSLAEAAECPSGTETGGDSQPRPALQQRARRLLALEEDRPAGIKSGPAIRGCLRAAAGGALPPAELLDQALSELASGPPATVVWKAGRIDAALAQLDAPAADSVLSPPTADETAERLRGASTWIVSESDGALVDCSAFAPLPRPLARLVESHLEEQQFAPGQYLMRQGDEGTSLMLLLSGSVEISTGCGPTRRRITQTSRRQILGEMALVTGEPRSADVIALTPVRVQVLPAAAFRTLAAAHPQMAVVLTRLVAGRLGRSGRTDVLAGKALAGYQIRRYLGRGGMAVVYEAEAPHPPGRVALKMMSHRLVYDRVALHQFQREADLIESFHHENIVRMYGRFTAFGTYFIVMELCRGRTLARLIARSGPFPEADVRRILGQTARALGYAHAAGVVHRDIKPSNLIVTRQGKAMLTDFGLALPITGADLADDEPIAGTPRYMAPEQWEGSVADCHSDYFSLGCVVYEMLAGQPLFAESQWLDLLRRHTDWDLPDLDQSLGHISPELRDVVRQCLRRDPRERTVNLEQLAGWADPIDYRHLRQLHRPNGPADADE